MKFGMRIFLVIFLEIMFTVFLSCTPKKDAEVTLRKFPYPYKAALTIASDIDGTTREEFLEIHKFLNIKEMTLMGRGLGLEIGDSFYMYSTNPTINNKKAKVGGKIYDSLHYDPTITYFKQTSTNISEDAQLITDFIKAGYIDTIHTFGNFSGTGGFQRQMAINALDEMKSKGIKVDVWINHGDDYDTQGMYPGFPTRLGDNPDAKEYHSNLTIPYGIKFIWKEPNTSIVGQDRLLTWRELFDERHPIQSLISILDSLWGDTNIKTMSRNNTLLELAPLDDGQKIYLFKRFNNHPKGVYEGANPDALIYQLSDNTLKQLINNEGYMIIYTHLGDHKKRGFSPEGIFSQGAIKTLKNLASEYERGNIYVTTTSKLLNYNIIHKNLEWSSRRQKDGSIIIEITGVFDEIKGKKYLPTAYELQGTTFYTPYALKTRIYIGKKEVLEIKENPPDYTGKQSVSIPLVRLNYPEAYLN